MRISRVARLGLPALGLATLLGCGSSGGAEAMKPSTTPAPSASTPTPPVPPVKTSNGVLQNASQPEAMP